MWRYYTSSTWERMERHNGRRRSRQIVIWSSDLELKTSNCGRFRSGKVFGAATCGSGSGISSVRRVALGGLGVAEGEGWTLGVVNFSGKTLGSLDTCHYPDAGQILTTIDALASLLVGVCEREKSRKRRYSDELSMP